MFIKSFRLLLMVAALHTDVEQTIDFLERNVKGTMVQVKVVVILRLCDWFK